ncbi:MAG: hypothetical protein EVG15_09415 [Candidatus Acididesulfobacter diazotrophicus]|jgi:translation initiation factor 2 beta subunit (eIF-2beta)/eIF-5|uniref:Uncharacterized protein n=1 Tax=Candidatus Acididesulfobacter diazotrophicus TaxID=2597226 RepID=A0A519BKK8_9DELT|nr:MAG: hypothetical protein EVG15_09415 [Candidatus Acididesulfobacter diazotrophicus]
MIAKETLIDSLLKKLKSMPVGHYYDVRSYKRDRGFYVIKSEEDEYCILERGFFEEEYVSDLDGLNNIFKKLLKIEFPRSHKIRVYNMGKASECILKKPKRKKI